MAFSNPSVMISLFDASLKDQKCKVSFPFLSEYKELPLSVASVPKYRLLSAHLSLIYSPPQLSMANLATLPVEVENSVSQVPVLAIFRFEEILLNMKYDPDEFDYIMGACFVKPAIPKD